MPSQRLDCHRTHGMRKASSTPTTWKILTRRLFFHLPRAVFFVLRGVSLTPAQSELVPCMDAVNHNYMETISMVKRYRPVPANRRHTQMSSTTSLIDSSLRDSSAIKIQALVRRHQAYSRCGYRDYRHHITH